jgi:hypothetical protein
MGDIKLDKAKIYAPRIGLCANNITLINGSEIDASFRGCDSDSGLGSVKRHQACAGAGGSHGGYGGAGASESHN